MIAIREKTREEGEVSKQTLQRNTANTLNNVNETINHINEAAQYNGWRAASHLQMPLCSKLVALEKNLLGIRCKPHNVTFSTVVV